MKCVVFWCFGITLSLFVASPLVAQVDPDALADPSEAMPLPDDWFQRPSGPAVGMELNRRALEDGRAQVFDFNFRSRPAIGAQVAYQGRNVLVIEDDDGQIERLSLFNDSAWDIVTETVYTYFPDEFDMIMVLINWDEFRAQGFYRPLANSIRGLGFQHLYGVQSFNLTNSDTLDGLIFMNNYRSYLGRNGEPLGRFVFLQEIGHRWGSYVWYGGGLDDGQNMLGRDESHWSYFMHTTSSAMEGNSWDDNGGGDFSTRTNVFRMGFSDLDLYLMGFKPLAAIEPWFLIRNPDVNGQRDEQGRTINPASSPAIFGRSVSVEGERYDITLEDVQRAEGERIPSFEDSQKVWRVATVLVLSQNSTFTATNLNTVETMLDTWESIFETETENQADLILTLEGDVPIPGQAAYGEPCETAADCDPASATTCLGLDDGSSVCSHRCVVGSECELGFCCSQDFCYPPSESICADAAECVSDADCAGCCSADGDCLEPEDAACGEGMSNTSNGTVDQPGETTGGGLLGGEDDDDAPGLLDGSGAGATSTGGTSGCSVASPVQPGPSVAVFFMALFGLFLSRRRFR